MKLLSKLATGFDRTIEGFAVLAAIIIAFLFGLVCVDVVLRYFFGAPIIWRMDVAAPAILYITLLVAAWLLREERHTKMDIVLTRLKPGTQTVINIITSSISALVCLLLVWYGTQVTYDHYQTGLFTWSTMEFPVWTAEIIVPVAGLLLFIQFLRRISGYFRAGKALRGGEKTALSMDRKPEL